MRITRDGYKTFSLSLSLSVIELLAAGDVEGVTEVPCGDAVGPSLAITASAWTTLEIGVAWRPGVDGSLVVRDVVNASSYTIALLVSRLPIATQEIQARATHLRLQRLLGDLEGLELGEDLGEDCVLGRHADRRAKGKREREQRRNPQALKEPARTISEAEGLHGARGSAYLT